MNSNWRNRPTTIDYIPRSIDYIISIDESGNANLSQVIKAKASGQEVAQSEKHFEITACVIPTSEFENTKEMVMNLKHKYWNNAIYNYNGTEKRICWHSREIRGKKDAFNPSLIDYDMFISDLSNLISNIPMTIYSSHIDKEKHVNQYKLPIPPYDLCMTFVIERIMKGIPYNATCLIVLEARGANEDKKVLNHIKNLIDNGNQYYDKHLFSKIKGVYFNPKWCHLAEEKKSYWALELADLCAYPIYKYCTYGERDKAFDIILPKISGYPKIFGKGLKSFP